MTAKKTETAPTADNSNDEIKKLTADLKTSEETSAELAKMNDDQKADLVDSQKAVEDLKAELKETIDSAQKQLGDQDEAIKILTAERDEAIKTAEASKDDKKTAGAAVKSPKDLSKFLEDLMSFAGPVRGALNGKPKVQESWNELTDRAVKIQRSIK